MVERKFLGVSKVREEGLSREDPAWRDLKTYSEQAGREDRAENRLVTVTGQWVVLRLAVVVVVVVLLLLLLLLLVLVLVLRRAGLRVGGRGQRDGRVQSGSKVV